MIYIIYSEQEKTTFRKCDTFAMAEAILSHILEGEGSGKTRLLAVINGTDLEYRVGKVTFNILNSEA